MIILVGLGNPGAKYAGNRHNVGFMTIDAIADRHGLPPFRSKFQAEATDGRICGERVLLIKPQTFYNESGRAVQEAARFHKVSPEDVIVFHDEIDLAPGKLRIKKGGGLAGNNGLKSIAAHLSPDVWRVRIGIGHPGHKDAVTHHVLKDFAKEEQNGWLGDMLRDLPPAINHILPPSEDGGNRFVSAVLQPGGGKPKAQQAKPSPASGTTPASEAGTRSASPFEALKKLVGKKD